MATSTSRKRPIPLLERFYGRSRGAHEARARLAEEFGVDEATVDRWVASDELPPDEVIVSLLGPCGPLDARLTYQLAWVSVAKGEIPERWRPMVAVDTVLRMEHILPNDCQGLVELLDERLAFDPPVELPADCPDVAWRKGPLPRIHSRAQCQRLRHALLEFMAEPQVDDELEAS